MPTRPVFYEETAKYFRDLRVARKLGFRQMVTLAQAASLTAITVETLRGLEKGKTKVPDADVLRDISLFYEVPYEYLAGLFVRHLYGLSVSAAGTPTNSESQSDGSVGTMVREPRPHVGEMPEANSDRLLLSGNRPYGLTDPVATRSSLERVIAELTAIAKQLPRRQVAMARRARSRITARPRRSRGQSDRAATKKASGR